MQRKQRVKVIFEPISKRVIVDKGTTIMNALKNIGLVLDSPCGGLGTCGKCKVICKDQTNGVSKLTQPETKLLSELEIKQGYRLACQTQILDSIKVNLPEHAFGKNAKIIYDSLAKRNVFKEKYFEIELDIPEPSIDDPNCHYNRFILAFCTELGINISEINKVKIELPQIRELSKILKNDSKVWVKFRKEKDDSIEILQIHDGNHKGIFGIAIDLGTTTIVGYMYNMINGELIGQHATINPQVEIGEDMVTRLTHIAQNNSLNSTAALAKKGINSIIKEICNKNNIPELLVYEAVLVGNTAMHHIFFEMETYKLAVSPYIPVTKNSLYVSNFDVNLVMNPIGKIYSPPIIAGYVGGDTVACIEATQFKDIKEYTMMIDIGTNGEIVIGNKDIGMYAGSVAAGSALEGAHISSGMRAASGSIEKIQIDQNSLEPTIQIIGDSKPIGICGSGMIDIIAELLKSKLITRSGRFNVSNAEIMNSPRIEKDGSNISYIVHSKKCPAINAKTGKVIEAKSSDTIKFTQQDVREFQKAKGAFLSGAYLINQQIPEKVRKENFDALLVAGAFGSYINLENARFVGLFPDIELDKITQLGNAAGLGAQNMLINDDRKEYASDASKIAKHVQIVSIENFQKHFAECMIFPHKDIKKFDSVASIYKDIPMR